MRIFVCSVVPADIKIRLKIVFDFLRPFTKIPTDFLSILDSNDVFVSIVTFIIQLGEPFKACIAESNQLDGTTILFKEELITILSNT